jgi:hypothetical protein
MMRPAKQILGEALHGTNMGNAQVTVGGEVIAAIIRAQALDRLTDAVLEVADAIRPNIVERQGMPHVTGPQRDGI